MIIHVTEDAIKQIEIAAGQSGTTGLPLRIATARTPEGGLDYRMGFDDEGVQAGDSQDCAGSVIVVVAADDQPLLEGTVLDYVEIEKGQFHFIFDNPNDPSHSGKNRKK